jgi:hypothetical protein
LTDHVVENDAANHQIEVCALDEPDSLSGACHCYEIQVPNRGPIEVFPIRFQKGPIPEAGVNGITGEALMAIMIDRLRGFQSGQFSCRENAIALTHLEDALMWLQKRTRDRITRRVEGTHKP